MNRDIESTQNKGNIDVEENICNKFKLCIVLLITLAALRVFNLDILWTLSDLITAAVIYFTYTSKSSLMAIFCLVNGIIGVIYSIIKGINDFKIASGQKGIKFFYVITVILLSFLVYTLISYFSYQAYKIYKKEEPSNQNSNNVPSANYGALNIETKNSYKAFSGKGYSIS